MGGSRKPRSDHAPRSVPRPDPRLRDAIFPGTGGRPPAGTPSIGRAARPPRRHGAGEREVDGAAQAHRVRGPLLPLLSAEGAVAARGERPLRRRLRGRGPPRAQAPRRRARGELRLRLLWPGRPLDVPAAGGPDVVRPARGAARGRPAGAPQRPLDRDRREVQGGALHVLQEEVEGRLPLGRHRPRALLHPRAAPAARRRPAALRVRSRAVAGGGAGGGGGVSRSPPGVPRRGGGGGVIVTEEMLFGMHVQAVARAVDGQLRENGRDFYARSEDGLPSHERLEREVRALIRELEALRTAPVIDPYTGPAILAPEATGVLFHEAVGHRLEGERQEDDKEGQTFKGQVGKPILPSFLSVIDDPTLTAEAGVELNGSYLFDDQGVPAQRTTLVQDGVLRSHLLSRQPVKPFARSNGHGRSQGASPPLARMGNLVVASRRGVSMAKLKKMLLAEAKRQDRPYGLIIQDITGGNTNTMSFGYQAFKGTPRLVFRVDVATGREELVRGVELVGTPLSSLNNLQATGEEPRVFNGFCGAESGFVPVSTVAPAALVSEIELQRVAQANERSPILPAPWIEVARP